MTVLLSILTIIGMIFGGLSALLIVPAIIVDMVKHKFYFSKIVLIMGAVTLLPFIVSYLGLFFVGPK